MKSYFVKTPKLLRSIYSNAIWSLPNTTNTIYLTFDDGPIPEITENTLDILAKYNIEGTFFCVGENAKRNPDILERIMNEGHQIGNHTFNHLKGWNVDNTTYFNNVSKCAEQVPSALFRPPYGKAKRSQLKELDKTYKVIMWDVLSGDFDPKLSVDDVVNNVLCNTESGSIIVMHDNEKCGGKMLEALPLIIDGLGERGFQFGVL